LKPDGGALFEQTAAAGLLGDYVTLDLVIALTPQGSSKATEVGLALFGEAGRDCRAVRVALLDGSLEPLSRRFVGAEFVV
jgi:hypothetical protein